MIFKKKYFRKIPAAIEALQQVFFIGVPCDQFSIADLHRLGLSNEQIPLGIGVTFLPAKVGKYSAINADGEIIIRKDLPKETFYQDISYTWKEWHGPDQVEQEGTRSIARKRFQRERLDAPNIMLTVMEVDEALHFLIRCEPKEEHLLLKLNLSLELFGEFNLLLQSKKGLITLPHNLKVVPWTILRSGEMSATEIKEAVENSISLKIRKTVRPVILQRLSHIRSFNPPEVVIGFAGYRGYVIHNFPKLKISVLESEFPDNATYIFDYENWESLSKLSKTQIIRNHLEKARVIHDENWKVNITRLLTVNNSSNDKDPT